MTCKHKAPPAPNMVKMGQGKGEPRNMVGEIGHLHKCINCVKNQRNQLKARTVPSCKQQKLSE